MNKYKIKAETKDALSIQNLILVWYIKIVQIKKKQKTVNIECCY